LTGLLVGLGVLLGGGELQAFNPPVDEAGPLRVTIQGPQEFTTLGTATDYRVILQNRGSETIRGKLDFRVIDGWRTEPAGPVAFEVAGQQKSEIPLSVTAAEDSYPAHYPIHVWARFEAEGRSWEAHPILIVEVKVPPRLRPRYVPPWTPVALRPNQQLALWQLPLWRVCCEVFGKPVQVLPIGWEGTVEGHRGSFQVSRVSLGGISRAVLSMHPPWFEGQVGRIWVEYPLELPGSSSIRLRMAAAVRPDGQGDGVTFRIRAIESDAPEGTLGEALFEQHIADKSWRDCEADLSRLAGRKIRLQLEAHPGPRNNTGWDQCYWAEPILEVGRVPAASAIPEQSEAGSVLLGRAQIGDTPWEYRLWPGHRGWVDATIAMVSPAGRILFRGFQVRVLGMQLEDPRAPVVLVEEREESGPNFRQRRHRFQSLFGTFDLLMRFGSGKGPLQVSFALENVPEPKPFWAVYLEDIATGSWSAPIFRVYAGPGNVVQKPGAFRLGFDGHRLSTSFVGLEFEGGLKLVQAVDLPPTALGVDPEQQHASLHVAHHATFSFIPHTDLWEAVKVYRQINGLQASGGVAKAAGRFVFDLWGGRYRDSAEQLRRAFRYGMTDSMVIWHNWQRWGYDYRLPEIFPPNPQYGTMEDMLELIAVCKAHQVPFALHDNYIDFYPDAQGFSYRERIAFHQSGLPVRAWLNEGRGAQSYRYRADQIRPFLDANLELIQRHLAPTAYFIDVWSSAPPYDYWTADGRFFDRVYTRQVWGEAFAWIRDLLGDQAPQISESGHDQLIGWLDGAQTNHLRVGKPIGNGRHAWAVWNWPCEDAERVPWFDAAHHDRFILHGAGYSSRYEAGLDPRLHGIFSDDYICTEVLTGHPGMVPHPPFSRNNVRKYWLTQGVARALALQTIERVEFVGNDLHRQQVIWSNGGEVWVNRGETDWQLDRVSLPPFGFWARVPVQHGFVEASIARREGIITESSSSPDMLYVNGRQPGATTLPIRAAADGVRVSGPSTIEFATHWQADVPIAPQYRPFVHLCDANGEIVIHGMASWPSGETSPQSSLTLPVRATVPADLALPASLELRVGWFNPQSGHRLPLLGIDDGTQRLRLGQLRLEKTDRGDLRVAWSALEPEKDPLLARLNPEARAIDFGAVVTAGGCRLHPENQALVVTPLPASGPRPWTVEIRWDHLPWKLPIPRQVIPVLEDGTTKPPQLAEVRERVVRLECSPEVFAYRLE